MTEPSPPFPPPPGDLEAMEPPPPRPVFAGFRRRTVALFIDLLLVAVPMFVMILIFFPETLMLEAGTPPPTTAGHVIFQILAIFAWIAYMAGFESSRYQATVGKHVMGILVTDRRFRRASFGRCVKRGWFYWLPGAVALIDTALQVMVLQTVAFAVVLVSCAMVAFTARKQALHDILADCYLIRRDESKV